MSRSVLLTMLATTIALVCFAVGSYFGAKQAIANDDRIETLRVELATLKRHELVRQQPTGTSGHAAAAVPSNDRHMLDQIKRQLQTEMGLLPVKVLRSRKESFVELYSYDDRGGSSYGTAGYLGDGYFITVKHGVVALDPTEEGREPRHITSVKLLYRGRGLRARIVDTGNAKAEVDPGDWAVLKVSEPVDIPALSVDLGFSFEFADPIFRLGNDYSKGIILSTGYVGQRTSNNLVTCLTDGHPGVSGGGVLDGNGSLVAIPIGRMEGDYRFSFMLPLRAEMFRKVPHVQLAEVVVSSN